MTHTSTSLTSLSPTPALTDEGILATALDSLLSHIAIDLQGTCSRETLFEVLLRAASRGDSIEHASQRMEGVPCGNGIRYHLDKFDDMGSLEEQVNAALVHQLPYASIYLIRRHHRVTLAIHPVRSDETLVAVITRLLARLRPLKIKIQCLLLDRGFYSVPVIRWLKALNIPFLMPAVIRGKQGGTRQFCHGRSSYFTTHNLQSGNYGSVEFSLAVVCHYHKGRQGKHGIDYRLYVVYRLKIDLYSLSRYYRTRFGIETSYRLKNHCRIRTSSKNPVVRLLFVALAFILVNIWIYLLWFSVSQSRRGGRFVYHKRFPLKTLLEFLAQAIERRFPTKTKLFLPAS
jgi:putative transposase